MFIRKSSLNSVRSMFVLGLLAAVVGGCGAGNSEDSKATASGKGTVTFHITDAPVDSAKHVFIKVASLEVAREGEDGGWIKIPLEKSEEFDLLALQNGASNPLASLGELEAGKYGQIRLMLDPESPPRIVIVENEKDVSYPLFIPSAHKTGVKIVSGFEVVADETLELTIDFDLRKSIIERGSARAQKLSKKETDESGTSRYLMKPVLRLTKNAEAGSISGDGENVSVVCVYKAETQPDATAECENAIASSKPKDGKFKAAFLEPGKYSVRVFKKDDTKVDIEEVTVKPEDEVQVEVL